MVGGTSSEATSDDSEQRPADQRILDATLTVLARNGLAGASMRAVAAEAGLSVGLANYHFENKTALICAALKRVGDQDAQMVASCEGADPTEHLRQCLQLNLEEVEKVAIQQAIQKHNGNLSKSNDFDSVQPPCLSAETHPDRCASVLS